MMIFGGHDMGAIAWLSRQEIVALGWALLHFCWQGTAVAVAYAIIDRMTAHATSKVRYIVPLAALMIMPGIVLGTFALELRVATPVYSIATASTNAPVDPAIWPTPALHELPLASGLENSTDWLAMRADRMLPWVDAVWLVGVLLLALRSLGGWFHLAVVRRRARRMVPHEIERAFLRLCERVQVGRKVVLRASDEVISPLAMGLWRATVILPISAVLSLPAEELEAVIAHELGHIRRWDYLWNLIQTAVESVLFFHPAVWWLSRTVRERRELCCDEIAVQSCTDATVYARALLRLEEQRTIRLRMAMAFGGCGGSLLQRIKKVLGEDMAIENRMTSGVSAATAGALIIALLLGPKIGQAVVTPVTPDHPVVAFATDASHISLPSLPEEAEAPPVVPPLVTPAAVAPLAPIHPPKQKTAAIAPLPPRAGRPHALPSTMVAVNGAMTFVFREIQQQSTGTASTQMTGTSYLEGMRQAGYPLDLNNDLNQLVALKSIGVTPEYAKSMGAAGLGKPTLHELITLKSIGVTPEYATSMKQSGIAPKTFQELVTEKSIGVTPEYAAEMKQKGFGDLSMHELITMKSIGVTPEYAAEMKQKGFGDLSMHELITMKSLGVTPEYAAAMKQQGFSDLSAHELITLKAQGMTPEYASWLKQQFPQATTAELRHASIMHINEKFVADAKAHGFDPKNLDKLLRLKMSGLLDE
jgi:beta-lactamase regulating signal transducer with metallopeptidase domain